MSSDGRQLTTVRAKMRLRVVAASSAAMWACTIFAIWMATAYVGRGRRAASEEGGVGPWNTHKVATRRSPAAASLSTKSSGRRGVGTRPQSTDDDRNDGNAHKIQLAATTASTGLIASRRSCGDLLSDWINGKAEVPSSELEQQSWRRSSASPPHISECDRCCACDWPKLEEILATAAAAEGTDALRVGHTTLGRGLPGSRYGACGGLRPTETHLNRRETMQSTPSPHDAPKGGERGMPGGMRPRPGGGRARSLDGPSVADGKGGKDSAGLKAEPLYLDCAVCRGCTHALIAPPATYRFGNLTFKGLQERRHGAKVQEHA